MRNWPVAYRDISTSSNDRADPAPAVPFDVTPLPSGSVLGGENLAISMASTKPRAAQELIEFLTSARSQHILFERGGFAATREVVYHDETIRKTYRYTQTLLQAIQRAKPRPVTPCYTQFSEVLQEAVTEALNGDHPMPDDIIETLEKP